jgi:hypothetical protein
LFVTATRTAEYLFFNLSAFNIIVIKFNHLGNLKLFAKMPYIVTSNFDEKKSFKMNCNIVIILIVVFWYSVGLVCLKKTKTIILL